jgi:SOS-response transcriptional repressor LexA
VTRPPFTPRQGLFLAFIHAFVQRRGIAPSFEEIASHFGISSPSVNGMVKTLERNGLLSRVPGMARSLRVLVPAVQLPGGDFGASPAQRPPSPKRGASTLGASASDGATAAAIAVLDVLMPQLKAEERQVLVLNAARAVQVALEPLVGHVTSTAVGTTVSAEAARWSADGRGTVVRKRQWVKRSR